MDGFEFFFSLSGLLLGFSLVEVIAGFGRAIEHAVYRVPGAASPPTRVGWLSPLLGLFVVFNLLSFWTAAWSLRDAIPVHYLSLLFALAVTAGYYLAAMLVFPRIIQRGTDLDDNYFAVKRWVLAVVVACNLLGAAGMALVDRDAVPGPMDLVFYGLLVALFFARGRRANLLILVPLAAIYPLSSLVSYAL
jgi:hypothetical protein